MILPVSSQRPASGSERSGLLRAAGVFGSALLLAGALSLSFAKPVEATSYRVIPLVSDLSGVAPFTDPNLVNPWGMATSATSPFWVANNGTGLSTIYQGSGQPQSLVVVIPPSAGGPPPSSPTGIAYNGTSGFEIASGSPARFIFATEEGGISGWNPGVNPTGALLEIDNSGAGAVYKGLALAVRASGGPTIYATNFHSGTIEAFDSLWNPVFLPGSFTDPNLPAGFAPFGIALFGVNLVVTYAHADAQGKDDLPGPGQGFVDVFDTDGNLIRRLISQGELNSPWGLAAAPASFGEFGGDLLVGNFGDGRINAFDPANGDFRGSLSDSTGTPLSIEGLWSLLFGNGGNGGDPGTLYFTAGISGGGQVEDHGLLGAIEAAGEPTPVLLASFDATAGDDGILLSWSVTQDAGSLSFHVYRSGDDVEWWRIDRDPVQESNRGRFEYLDDTAEPGVPYSYRIAILEKDGSEDVIGSLRTQMGAPSMLSLHASPSPAAAAILLDFALPRAGTVTIEAFDVSGRRVATILDSSYTAGVHRLAWNRNGAAGGSLPAGRYFVKLKTEAGARTIPVTLLR